MTYDKEILKNDYVFANNKKINIFNLVSFVSLKNGVHTQKGFLYFDSKIKKLLKIKKRKVNIIQINNYVKKIFGDKSFML